MVHQILYLAIAQILEQKWVREQISGSGNVSYSESTEGEEVRSSHSGLPKSMIRND